MFVSVTQWLTIFFVIQGAIIYQFANRDLWTSMSKRVTTSFANLQLSSSTFPPSHHQLYFSTSVCNYDGMTITASHTHDASSSRRWVGAVKPGLFMSDGFHPMGMIMGIPKLLFRINVIGAISLRRSYSISHFWNAMIGTLV